MLNAIVQGAALQMLGDPARAIATLEEEILHYDLNGDPSQSHFESNPGFIYWMEADLSSMQQTAERALMNVENYQVHQMSQALYFMGIALYHRNELQAMEEKLTPVLAEPYSQYAWNFIHSAFAFALAHQARGRTDAANQVAESVVSYGFDTRHPLVLKLARAFQAELTLRQGRTAEASHWAEQFITKPFAPMYRFYVPELTLVKVLLAKDTGSSFEQAADLLKQLYDFVIFTHNKRFQIDVLALQTLRYDSKGNGPAAIESLTNALQLGEPGGFIRLFVDLGPQMADLLKRLQKQNVAVDYIERILAAFRDDEHRTVPDASNHGHSPDSSISQSSNALLIPHSLRGVGPYVPYGPEAAFPIPPSKTPHHPLSPSPRPAISQPLVEPLTNRELDVLELLARRLSNKEIADKLYISTTTVKSHIQNLYGKLNVRKRREAVERAMKIGIL
jgi:LuxR family maltose regulon positive regulatory protein